MFDSVIYCSGFKSEDNFVNVEYEKQLSYRLWQLWFSHDLLIRYKFVMNSKIKYGDIIFTFFLFSVVAVNVNAEVVLEGRFDGGNFGSYWGLEANGISLNATSSPDGISSYLERVPDPLGSGNMVMRATRFYGDLPTNGGYRSEVSAPKDVVGSERWYSWGYLIPSSWKYIQNDVIFAQIQGSTDPGEDSLRPPPLALIITNDTIKVYNSFDYDKITSIYGVIPIIDIDFERRMLASWELELDSWVFMDIHVKWASDDTGFLSIWKNGELIFEERDHINTFNDEGGVWFKNGTYVFPTEAIWPFISTYSTGVKIGDGEETLESMSLSIVQEPDIYSMIVIGFLGIVGWRRSFL